MPYFLGKYGLLGCGNKGQKYIRIKEGKYIEN